MKATMGEPGKMKSGFMDNMFKAEKDLFEKKVKADEILSPLKVSTTQVDLDLSFMDAIDSMKASQTVDLTESTENEIILKNINFKIKKGASVAIIGKPETGKSSLISSLFAEMYKKDFDDGPKTQIKWSTDSISYVGQMVWLQCKSIKDNVLFYSDYDEERYNDALKYSHLTAEIETFKDKDDTLLGDKGIMLNEDQKVRVSLARALYSNKEIYVMDDIHRSLEGKMEKLIIQDAILGYLKGKTRLVITGCICHVKLFDYVIIMEGGRISQQGTFEEIENTHCFKALKIVNKEAKMIKKQAQKLMKRKKAGDTEKILEKIKKETKTPSLGMALIFKKTTAEVFLKILAKYLISLMEDEDESEEEIIEKEEKPHEHKKKCCSCFRKHKYEEAAQNENEEKLLKNEENDKADEENGKINEKKDNTDKKDAKVETADTKDDTTDTDVDKKDLKEEETNLKERKTEIKDGKTDKEIEKEN